MAGMVRLWGRAHEVSNSLALWSRVWAYAISLCKRFGGREAHQSNGSPVRYVAQLKVKLFARSYCSCAIL